MRIVNIVDNPFTERDHSRFGVDVLRRNGFEVETWDLTPIHGTGERGNPIGPPVFEGHRRFFDRGAVLLALEQLEAYPSRFAICFLPYLPQSRWVYAQLSRRNIPYAVIATNNLPSIRSLAGAPRLAARLTRLTPRRIAGYVMGRVPARLFGVKPAAAALVGGSLSLNGRYPISGSTTIVRAHNLDYDLFLAQPGPDAATGTDRRQAVFLDEFLPFHPDHQLRGTVPSSPPDEYFSALRCFFDIVEREQDVAITVAAHPRSDYERRPDCFGNRPVVKGRTIELVRGSRFVINHSSTALNFAVLYRKPIMFVTTTRVNRSTLDGPIIADMAQRFGKTLIVIDQPWTIDWSRELQVDADIYARYSEEYIKSKDSPAESCWQIFANYLKCEFQSSEPARHQSGVPVAAE